MRIATHKDLLVDFVRQVAASLVELLALLLHSFVVLNERVDQGIDKVDLPLKVAHEGQALGLLLLLIKLSELSILLDAQDDLRSHRN